MGVYVESARNITSDPINMLTAPGLLIDCAQTEQKLFEALIELDFAEVYNESGMVILTEEDKAAASAQSTKKLSEKIKEKWNKFVQWIKDKWNQFVDAVDKMLKDSVLSQIDKNIDKGANAPLKAADGTDGDYWYADIYDAYEKEYNSVIRDFPTFIEAKMIEPDDATLDVTEVLRTAAECKQRLSDFNYITKISKVQRVNSSQLQALKQYIGFKSLTNDVKKTFDALVKKPGNYDTVKSNTAQENNKFKLSVAMIGYRTALFSFRLRQATKTMSQARRNYVQIAQHAKKMVQMAGTATNEEALLIGAASDLFCESVFEAI